MKSLLILLSLAMIAAAPRSPNLMRSAISEAKPLTGGESLILEGETDDDDRVVADIAVAKIDARLSKISVEQDGRSLTLPPAAYDQMKGASRAWLEERGALTTLVIEGTSAGKDWRLALEFHPKQLWLRRLSTEGERKDEFTFYDRDDLEPTKVFRREALSRGFHE